MTELLPWAVAVVALVYVAVTALLVLAAAREDSRTLAPLLKLFGASSVLLVAAFAGASVLTLVGAW